MTETLPDHQAADRDVDFDRAPLTADDLGFDDDFDLPVYHTGGNGRPGTPAKPILTEPVSEPSAAVKPSTSVAAARSGAASAPAAKSGATSGLDAFAAEDLDIDPSQRFAFEPDHTVAPQTRTSKRMPARRGAAPVQPAAHPSVATARRGTLDTGLFLLRMMLGGVFVFHGLQKATGWWNGPGFDGLTRQLAHDGWEHPRVCAAMLTAGELGGGLLVVIGLFTPLAAGAVLACMVDAWLVHQAHAPGLQFSGANGVELQTILAASAAALILTGPGRISLDMRRSWAVHPGVGSVLALVAAGGAATLTWVLLHGGNPLV